MIIRIISKKIVFLRLEKTVIAWQVNGLCLSG